MDQLELESLRRAPFSLYGLDDSWSGARTIASYAFDAEGIPSQIGLGHGTLPAQVSPQPAHAQDAMAAKVPMFNCHDCGDCSLPEIAYVCPESICAKNQRNGPCGGTRDGLCEVYDTECIWSQAYERLKAYGEEESMLDGPVAVKDNSLEGTSAWANTFLGRDHLAREWPE